MIEEIKRRVEKLATIETNLRGYFNRLCYASPASLTIWDVGARQYFNEKHELDQLIWQQMDDAKKAEVPETAYQLHRFVVDESEATKVSES